MATLHRIKSSLRRLLVRRPGPVREPAPTAAHPAGAAPTHRRLLGDTRPLGDAFLRGAGDYVDNLAPDEARYLYLKPFDPAPGNAQYYVELYLILNILEAMNLPPGACVLEVGSGPGWVTEIMAMHGFRVEALEPCEAMIRIARERLATCWAHHRRPGAPDVTFRRETLEDCTLPDGHCDAILFHESLHHLVDEDRGLRQAFRLLRPDGVLAISGEAAWVPGDADQERLYRGETARFGTLESPFTTEYLVHLLRDRGFDRVVHYHGVNGLFPVSMGDVRLRDAARFPAPGYNTFTARKPGSPVPTTADPSVPTQARISLLDTHRDGGKVRLRVRLENQGQSTWLPWQGSRWQLGYVSLAVRQGRPGADGFRELLPRCPLPEAVAPGAALTLEASYPLPEDAQGPPWCLDLVNEGLFWFSDRGTAPAPVTLGARPRAA